jgi:HSP20 family molecular chaperone IbpA
MQTNKKVIVIASIVIFISLGLLGNLVLAKKPASTVSPPTSTAINPQDPQAIFLADEFAHFDRELNSLLQLNSLFAERVFTKMGSVASLSTRLEEEPQQFVFFMDIPGVDPKAIDIAIKNRILTVKAQREAFNKHNKKDYPVAKSSQSYFYYRFALPDTADINKITAEVNRGVLKITLPKGETSPIKKVSIKLNTQSA